MEKTRIRVLFLGRPMGNRWSAEENDNWPVHNGKFSSENLSKYFTEKLGAFENDVVFTGRDLVRTREDLEGIGEKVKAEAGVLVFILCLYTHELQREIFGWGRPTIVVNPPESPLSPLAWMSNLQPAKGKRNVIAVASSDFADVGRKIGVLKAIDKLRQTRALYHYTDTSDLSRQRREEIFGRDSGHRNQSSADLADDVLIQQIKEKTGIEIQWISLERLVEAYETADSEAAEDLARQWIDGAGDVVEPTRQDVV